MLRPALSLLTLTFLTTVLPAAELEPPSGDRAIVAENARLEELWNEGAFTEGVAVDQKGTIYFSDITSDDSPGKIYRFDPASGETTVYCADSRKSNGLMFSRDGRLIAACGANFGGQCLAEITTEGLAICRRPSIRGSASTPRTIW